MTEDTTEGVAKRPEHPASQSDDGSYRGDSHSFMDGPDEADNPHHLGQKEDDFSHTADHSHVYHNMMRWGFGIGLPLGCAIVMLISLLLLGTNWLVAVFLSFLTWLGVLGFAKTFFVHDQTGAAGH